MTDLGRSIYVCMYVFNLWKEIKVLKRSCKLTHSMGVGHQPPDLALRNRITEL